MVYKIKKGSHYSTGGLKFGLTLKNKISFKVVFDESCMYDLGTSDNYDVNKLFGFSTSIFHHWQSARFGWRCINDNGIQILTYTYDLKQRQEPKLLGTVKPGDEVYCSVIKFRNKFGFKFQCNDKTKKIDIPIKQKCWPLKYYLYPYFGGNMPAPHDMQMEVEKL